MEITSIEEYQKAVYVEHELKDAIICLYKFREKLSGNEILSDELDLGKILWDTYDAEHELDRECKKIHRSIKEYVKNERERIHNMNSYELFIRSRMSDFVDGFNCNEAWGAFSEWVLTTNRQTCARQTFTAQIKKFCHHKRESGGKREWYLQLLPNVKNYFGDLDIY